jgi:O-antigen/teichoic acid export membrane protein
MNYTKIFYWLTVADSAKKCFLMLIMFGVITLIATLAYLIAGGEDDDEAQRLSRLWMWRTYPFFLFFLLAFVLIPSKKKIHC